MIGLACGAINVAAVGLVCAYRPSMPGQASSDLADLHPPFREKVEVVMTSLKQQGYEPVVRESWRDLERQAYYKTRGWSQTTYGFHNALDPDGGPGALAVDLGQAGLDGGRAKDEEAMADFYKALLRAALTQGLTTGGTWSQRNERWAAYDLGWDPGHLQPAHLTMAAMRRGER